MMLSGQRVITILLLAVGAISPTIAQDAQQRVDPAATPSVTAAASGSDLRFTAPGAVVQIRLEVVSPEGEKVFDSGDKPGNVLDWRMQEQQGALKAEASYLCMVTVRELSGRLSQRHGLVSLSAGRASFRRVERDQLTPAQVQVWEGSRLALSQEPVAQDGDALAIVVEGAIPALTALAHDGTDGQVTRTRGAFSFRFGDFFTGTDTEQMRLTEEGNLGIGTATPKAKLDVAGMISAREGLMFADGSTLNVNETGVLTRTTASGEIVSNVAGTGTQNRLAKWLETGGSGTLGNSTVTESNGRVGIGTTNPGGQLHIFGTATQDVFAGMGPDLAAGPALNYGYAGASFGRGAGFFNVRPDAGATPPNPSLRFITVNQERMIITNTGNVGIGTSSPNAATKLDVVGDINTSTQYRIGGNRVFSISETNNTFAGLNAGAANTTGGSNSFFGAGAGLANTSGGGNSFFGASAGINNTTAIFNSFFGARAGAANTTGGSNSFFGVNAGAANTGNSNAFFGTSAGAANTTAAGNSFFGTSAGAANTTGDSNAFFGKSAGQANTTGIGNSFFGNQAGFSNTTSNNSFFGGSSGQSNTTGTSNSFFGKSAGAANTTGNANSFFGISAGLSNMTGTSNSFFGAVAGATNTTGGANAFFGVRAGILNTTGSANSFFGTNAGDANTSGDSNVVIGNSAGGNLTTGNDNIYLASSPGANESSAIRIGTEGIQTRAFIAGISGNSVAAANGTTVFVDASGRLGTILSSRRFKQNIRAMGNASGKLMQLRPVTFLYKPEVVTGEQTLQYGLIAEEVAKIYPDLVQYAADGQPQTVRYHLLNTMLLNEVQKQQSHIQSQEHQIQAQTQRITNQAQQLQTQTQQLTRQAQQINSLETRLRRLETGASRRQRARR